MSGHGGKRKKHGAHEEEHENHERWLVSYADMMTLLMVLFIVLFAISAVDQKKFMELKEGLAASLGSPIQVTTSGTSVLQQSAESSTVVSPNLALGAKVTKEDQALIDKAADAQVKAQGRAQADAQAQRVAEEVAKLEADRKKILEQLKKSGLKDSLNFRYDRRGLVITLVTDKAVFASDRATLLPTGLKIVDAVAPALAKVSNNISVDGHTNTEPVKTKYYPDDYGLAYARAHTVMTRLKAKGVVEERMTVISYGHNQPLVKGTSAYANRVNKRVEIIIDTALDGDDASLLETIGNATLEESTGGSSSSTTKTTTTNTTTNTTTTASSTHAHG